jgi:transcriptional regulator with XRE-family HTH domain
MMIRHVPARQPEQRAEGTWPSPPDPGDLSRRVAARRKELRLSRAQVAARARINQRYLEYLERYPATPAADTLRRIAAALRTTPAALLGAGAQAPDGHGRRADHSTVTEKLLPDECRRLMAPGGVGRIAFTTNSGPVVLPVNFAMADNTIVIRTGAGTLIGAHADEPVAFEADHIWPWAATPEAAAPRLPGRYRRWPFPAGTFGPNRAKVPRYLADGPWPRGRQRRSVDGRTPCRSDEVRTMRSERRPRAARRDRKPRTTRLSRFMRGRRPDRNPLRRTSDRAETAVLAGVLIAFLAGAPFVAQACGTWAHGVAQRNQLTQQASWRQVPAVLLNAAPSSDPYPGMDPQALARWTAPDGKAVTGQVTVPAGTAAGTTVPIWVGQDGQQTNAPLQDSQVAGQTVLAEASGVIALASLLIITGLLVRRALDKRRMAGWDADWLATGPRWSPRR